MGQQTCGWPKVHRCGDQDWAYKRVRDSKCLRDGCQAQASQDSESRGGSCLAWLDPSWLSWTFLASQPYWENKRLQGVKRTSLFILTLGMQEVHRTHLRTNTPSPNLAIHQLMLSQKRISLSTAPLCPTLKDATNAATKAVKRLTPSHPA